MKKLLYILVFNLLFILNTNAQNFKFDHNWVISYNPNFGNLFNFNGDSLKIEKMNKKIALGFGGNTISNKDGHLLYYTNGCEINDTSQQAIKNGSGLTESKLKSQCAYGIDIMQMSTFLTFETSDTLLFIQCDLNDDYKGRYVRLYHISMKQNAVFQKETIIDDYIMKGMKAIKHSNGKDWWLIVNETNYKYYYAILITKNGVASVTKYNYPKEGLYNLGAGQVAASLDGKKYATVDYVNQLRVYDFDRCSGKLTNELNLPFEKFLEQDPTSVCFSPNNRFLYASTSDSLFQYDLQAPNVAKSRIVIDVLDKNFKDGALPLYFYLMEQGPDGRIYMCCSTGVKYMHFINKPNEKGKACDFRQHGITLDYYSDNVPNLANHRLGKAAVVCSTASEEVAGVEKVLVYPNPSHDQVFVQNLQNEAGTLSVYNSVGQPVYTQRFQDNQLQQIDVNNYPSGYYILEISYDNRERESRGFVVGR